MEASEGLNIITGLVYCTYFEQKNRTVDDINMEKNLPNMVGKNLPVMAYISPAVFMKIETMRGDVSRSRFLEKMIQKSIKEAC